MYFMEFFPNYNLVLISVVLASIGNRKAGREAVTMTTEEGSKVGFKPWPRFVDIMSRVSINFSQKSHFHYKWRPINRTINR